MAVLPNLTRVTMEIGAQEVWPEDVKLFQPHEVQQILLPDNANCLAVQAYLKICNLPYMVEARSNAQAMSPSGKVPFIKAGRFVVADLEGIIRYVKSKGIPTNSDELEQSEQTEMRSYMSLLHNVLELAELYICWKDSETYNQVTSVRNGSIYPWPLNHFENFSKRRAVLRKLSALDFGEKTREDVLEDVRKCCEALDTRLQKKTYFFNDKPTELDALVFGHLFTILTTPLPVNDLANTIRNFPGLIELVRRIELDYFKKEDQAEDLSTQNDD